MEAQVLLDKYFETAFSAPDGVKKLRELILSLAMQGKLVPQDPSDQPASELLKEIEAEKEKLIQEGKIKKSKPLPENTSDEIPYDLPESWEWVKLDDISIKIHYGYTASANHSLKNIRLLRITDIQDNKVNWDSVPGCDIKEKDIEQYILSNNDILIARTGGTVGKTYLVNNINVKSVFASYLIRVVPSAHLFVTCLKFFLESPLYWKQLYEKCSGTGQPNVNGTSLSSLLLPLPPLGEQRRIVEKINRLMEQCDRLEKLREEHHQKRLIIHTAARDRLLNAIDQNSLNQSWNFIQNNFGELYSVKENVSELRKIILQLAVMGKLVPQDPNDTPASELVKEIEAEKQRLIKEGKIKKQKPLPEIKFNEIPYKIPENWKWVKTESICEIIVDCPHSTPKFIENGIICIDTNSLKKVIFYFINYVMFQKKLT
ncbi:MAG: restriction endonuclease subunit S [Snowella sp.]